MEQEEHTITREKIYKLYYIGGENKGLLKEWFPDLFKPNWIEVPVPDKYKIENNKLYYYQEL